MEEQKHLIPIYLTNIVLFKYKSIGASPKLIEEVLLEKILVKGFSKDDISVRSKDYIFKKALLVTKLSSDCYFEIKSIELLSQHGCGVND